jgi:hypothetical protein
VQRAKWLAIGMCIAFVLGVYIFLDRTINEFNPSPTTTTISIGTESCSTVSSCSRFTIDSAKLTINETEDIVSQILTVEVTPAGDVSMAKMQVFLDNISLGSVEGPFAVNELASGYFPIPTTITVTQGNAYTVLIEGTFAGPAAQHVGDYIQQVSVTAT